MPAGRYVAKDMFDADGGPIIGARPSRRRAMRRSTAIVSIGLATLTVGLGLSGHIPVTISPRAPPPSVRQPVVVPAQPEARGKDLGNAAPLAPCNPDEATVATLQSELAEALQRKADLLRRYNGRHPAVVNVEAEIQDIDGSIAAVMTQCRVPNIERRAAESQRLPTPPVAVPVAPVTTLPSTQAWRQAPTDLLPSCSEGVSDSRPLPRNWPCDRAPNNRRPAAVMVEEEIRDIEPHAIPLPPVPERFPPGAVLQLVFSPPLIQRVQVPMPDMATCVQAIPQARSEFNPFLTECFVPDRSPEFLAGPTFRTK
jgi:hypothetical protein